jgi:hypothetical protein
MSAPDATREDARDAATPAADTQPRQSIEVAYRAMDAALAGDDVAGYLAFLADDFVEKIANGVENKARHGERWVARFAELEPLSLPRLVVQRVRSYRGGRTATARIKQTRTVAYPDIFNPRRINVSEEIDILLDTWVHTPNGWRLWRRREPRLVRELRQRFADDQAPRKRDDLTLEEQNRLVQIVYRDNIARLKQLIRQFGWPGTSLVGSVGAETAFLIAQHAVPDPAFQTEAFALLTDAVHQGEADPKHLAYLTDEMRVLAGEKQIFGTQPIRDADGNPILPPLEDPDAVDERRARIGLGPLDEFLAFYRNRA